MSKKEESLKDVFGMIQEALKDDAQMIQKRESRVREFETDSSLLKFPVCANLSIIGEYVN